MKRKNKDQLQNIDFPKYCKQIGILASDGLRLISNRKEFEELAAKHSDAGAHRAIDRSCLGKCDYDIRIRERKSVFEAWSNTSNHTWQR